MTHSKQATIILYITVCRAGMLLLCVVVPRVNANGISEGGHSLVQLLDEDVFVAEQSVGVRKVRVDLHRSLEESNCNIVFLLKTETVSSRTPRLANTTNVAS